MPPCYHAADDDDLLWGPLSTWQIFLFQHGPCINTAAVRCTRSASWAPRTADGHGRSTGPHGRTQESAAASFSACGWHGKHGKREAHGTRMAAMIDPSRITVIRKVPPTSSQQPGDPLRTACCAPSIFPGAGLLGDRRDNESHGRTEPLGHPAVARSAGSASRRAP